MGEQVIAHECGRRESQRVECMRKQKNSVHAHMHASRDAYACIQADITRSCYLHVHAYMHMRICTYSVAIVIRQSAPAYTCICIMCETERICRGAHVCVYTPCSFYHERSALHCG